MLRPGTRVYHLCNDVIPIAVYQKEVKANPEDAPNYEGGTQALTAMIDSWGDCDLNLITVDVYSDPEYSVVLNGTPNGGNIPITQFIVDDSGNPLTPQQEDQLLTNNQNVTYKAVLGGTINAKESRPLKFGSFKP